MRLYAKQVIMQSFLADVLSLLPGLRGSASMAAGFTLRGLCHQAHEQHKVAEGKVYVEN
jgi:hypothetical protein